ncbi:10088_t:CDS:2 [Funneliformis geosporum]|nr:10088_t:CDS:2 [Funneliformis geosporum]
MPHIEKIKPKKHLPVALKVTKKKTKTKTKPSPVEYYNYCKTKAPALNKQREQELQKLITSYRQLATWFFMATASIKTVDCVLIAD